MKDLRITMDKLSQDAIDKYKKTDAYRRTVTTKANDIIPKAFWASKKFLKENPHGLFRNFAPYFIQIPDDIEDPDEVDDENEGEDVEPHPDAEMMNPPEI